MSREIVACVASKPRWRSRRRSCSWLWSGSRSIEFEDDALGGALSSECIRIHDLMRMIIHRFSLIQSRLRVYKYSFRCIQFCTPDATRRAARQRRAGAGRARRRRRRHRLHRPGTAAAARRAIRRSRSPPRCRRAPARRRARLPALARLWDGAIAPLDRRTRSRATPTSSSWRCPTRRPPSSRPRSSTRACASSICRRVPPARRGRARALVSGNARGCPTGVAYGLTERERDAVAHGAARRQSRAAIRRRRCWRWRRSPTAGLLAARRRRHRRREVGRLGRRQDAVRADALLRSARQPVGLRRLRPPPRRRDRAGARPAR